MGANLKNASEKVLTVIIILISAGLWLAALFRISNLWRGDSDNASMLISSNSVLKGNYFLKGYYFTSLGSGFPIDVYLNALFIKILGFRPLAMHMAPVLSFVALIAVALVYVKDAGKEPTSFKTGIFMLAVFMALPVKAFAFWVLQGSHLSATVLSLVVFLLVNKYLKADGGKNPLYLFPAFIVLTAILLNDGLSFIICAVPLAVVSIYFIYSAYMEKAKSGKPVNILRLNRENPEYVLILLMIILSFAAREFIFLEIIKNAGFTIVPFGIPLSFVRLADFQKNIYLFANGILELFDINMFGKYFFSWQALINMGKLTGFFVFAAGIIYIYKKFKAFDAQNDIYFLDFLLLTGLSLLSAAFLFSDIAVSRASSRYLVPVVIYGFIIAFRNIPGSEAVRRNYGKPQFKLIAAVVFIVYAGSFIIASGSVIPRSPVRRLSGWLIGHNLKYGYAPYWDAGIVTLMSRSRVKVRQIWHTAILPGKIIPYECAANKNWYKRKGFFVIFSKNFDYGYINKNSVTAAFGKPSKIYVEDFQGTIGRAYGLPAKRFTMPPYVIMVYKNGIKVK